MVWAVLATARGAAAGEGPTLGVASHGGAGEARAGSGPGSTQTGAAIDDPGQQNQPDGAFERQLMDGLACMCGHCDREPISTCKCKVAAEMRGEVKGLLKTQDLSTEAGRRHATEVVRRSMSAEYGPKVLEPSHPASAGSVSHLWPVPLLGGTIIILIVTARRRGRRRRAGAA